MNNRIQNKFCVYIYINTITYMCIFKKKYVVYMFNIFIRIYIFTVCVYIYTHIYCVHKNYFGCD